MDWFLDSGRPCLDLVNTVRERHARCREQLTSPTALAEWLLAAGLVQRRPRVDRDQLARFRELREAIDSVLLDASEGRRPRAAAVRVLNACALTAPPPSPQLRVKADGTPADEPHFWSAPIPTVLAMLASDAVALAADLARSDSRPSGSADSGPTRDRTQPRVRVRVCASDDCGLRFADVSPKLNRQWCSMARCGNRAKARAHYARAQRS